ncbi:Inositol-1-monophosphatase [subsurface metagenome]
MIKNQYLDFTIKIAYQAGKLLNSLQAKVARSYKIKSTALDIVTKADVASENLILDNLRKKFPNHNILAEEEYSRNKNRSYTLANSSSGSFCWIIDPLDGTTNYSHGFPFYCVSIALTKNGKTILGVVYNPVMYEMFYAIVGRGAYLNKKRIRVSNIKSLSQGLLVTGFPYIFKENPGDNFQNFQKFSFTAQAIRRAGAAALDLCYVACSRFDGLWERELKPWDTSAGALILHEAGGKITDYKGNKYNPFKHREILASNKHIHREMIAVIKSKKTFL